VDISTFTSLPAGLVSIDDHQLSIGSRSVEQKSLVARSIKDSANSITITIVLIGAPNDLAAAANSPSTARDE
jgi:hypothetical protein